MSATTLDTTLHAEVRTDRGKEKAKKLRAVGKLPCVIYGGHGEPKSITLNTHELDVLIKHSHGDTLLIEIEFADGSEADSVFIKDVQRDPVKETLVHVDFLRIVRGEILTMTVPIHQHGEDPIGLKNEGILDQVLYEITVSAIPSKVPGHLEVDVSHLDVGDSIHVSDLPQLDGVTYEAEPETTVFTVGYKAIAMPEPLDPDEAAELNRAAGEEPEEGEEGEDGEAKDGDKKDKKDDDKD